MFGQYAVLQGCQSVNETVLIGYDHPETDADAAKYNNVLAMHLKMREGEGLRKWWRSARSDEF